MKVEVKDVGVFEIKHNYLHRALNPRLITFDNHKYKVLQYDSFRNDLKENVFQDGYDYELNKIEMRLINDIPK